MNILKLKDEITALKEKHNAIILAHNYQLDEVQEIADYTGDSFGLSKLAASTTADVIVFCGVKFMAESAYILSPEKTVLQPDLKAGCPLAESINPEELQAKKEEYPEAAVVCYVNSSAEIKALSDICCTSSNAAGIVNSLEENQVLFVPDKNLADYVAGNTEKEIIPWDGCCATHNAVTAADVHELRNLYPDGIVTVHPECRPEVIALADHVGSTAEMIRFAKETDSEKIIIGTEMGTLYKLKKDNPDKKFYLLSRELVCSDMKLNNLEKIKAALETMQHQVTVPENIRKAAFRSLDRMLQVKTNKTSYCQL